MTNLYFSIVEHIIKRLHKNFHNFIRHQQLVINLATNSIILSFLKTKNHRNTFLTQPEPTTTYDKWAEVNCIVHPCAATGTQRLIVVSSPVTRSPVTATILT